MVLAGLRLRQRHGLWGHKFELRLLTSRLRLDDIHLIHHPIGFSIDRCAQPGVAKADAPSGRLNRAATERHHPRSGELAGTSGDGSAHRRHYIMEVLNF